MARENLYRPFTPDPDQMAFAPEVSGNDINGLGEPEWRAPRPVYWAPNPDDIAHGAMQRWFYTVDPGLPDFAIEREKRAAKIATPAPDLAPDAAEHTPDGWTALLDQFVADHTCDKIGVAVMDPSWLFEGHKMSRSRIIVTAVQHDYDTINLAPTPEAGAEVMRQYTRAAGSAVTIAHWLRQQGWEAEPVTGPMAGAIALIPAAIAAGLGELGKHGSLINAEFGSSFRLSAVLTDAPFAPTQVPDLFVDDFCAACRICEDACPPIAIGPDKQIVRGVDKWYVDFDRCLPFFNQHQGCAICIAVCPWSRPGVGVNLAAKLARRHSSNQV